MRVYNKTIKNDSGNQIYDTKSLILRVEDPKVKEFIKEFYDWRGCTVKNLKRLIEQVKKNYNIKN